MKVFYDPIHFEWDTGNRDKNFKKHGVTNEECEEVFIDPHKRIAKDVLHSGKEERYILVGRTKKQRFLFIVFTMRRNTIRVISARDMAQKERKLL
jgi:uncharacterized DUF497 family protein